MLFIAFIPNVEETGAAARALGMPQHCVIFQLVSFDSCPYQRFALPTRVRVLYPGRGYLPS